MKVMKVEIGIWVAVGTFFFGFLVIAPEKNNLAKE